MSALTCGLALAPVSPGMFAACVEFHNGSGTHAPNAQVSRVIAIDATSLPSQADAVVRRVSRATGVTVSQIRGRSRRKPIVRARHAAWSLLDRLGWSIAGIAREFGVDHTSVLHALSKPEVRA